VPRRNDFLLLSPSCFLKGLEEPCVYNTASDELYELNAQAFDFLRRCDGSRRLEELPHEADFLDYCLEEDILTLTPQAQRREFVLEPSPIPSLRYLELQITARCNLKCRHCYLGEAKRVDMSLETIVDILRQFEKMQGLRLLISGGEPMMHPDFWELNRLLPDFGLRSVLITNGTLISAEVTERLHVREVQVSLDGLRDAHDAVRGEGSFQKSLGAIRSLRERGVEVSVATMVHARNLGDFPAMDIMLRELGVREWNVDVPCPTGRLSQNQDLFLPYQGAAPFLKYGYGGGLYDSSAGYACGANLCAVLPDGRVAKCGFFSQQTVGHVGEGLRACWERIVPQRLEELECHCSFVEECRGGCRYRALMAGGIRVPDPVQCYAHGLVPGY
jgi:radical SAM protein with 4Fe4S-binding SPASM domain